jgi:hypothetical protein
VSPTGFHGELCVDCRACAVSLRRLPWLHEGGEVMKAIVQPGGGLKGARGWSEETSLQVTDGSCPIG